MFIPFKELSGSSRVWIYQGNRFLVHDEITQIKNLAYDFVNNWTAHKQTLHAGFEIFHNLFLVLAVDPHGNDASGCSIDKAFQFIKEIERLFDVELLSRTNVAFKINHDLNVLPVNLLAKSLSYLNKNSISIFNNLVETKTDLENNWLQPIEESWVKNYL